MNIHKKFFGIMPDGQEIKKYTLKSCDISVELINYGGIITSIKVPDRDSNYKDIVLGYDTLEEYFNNPWYFGAVIGRVAGRIKDGKFKLDGKNYKLNKNEKKSTHLHGGVKDFDKVIWKTAEYVSDNSIAVILSYTSKDGEENYPGNLDVYVKYELSNNGEFSITYSAETDAPTPVTLTNHTYFNLNGTDFSNSVLNQMLQIKADRFYSLDENSIPISLNNVEGTPLDFRNGMRIGEKINEKFEGYDHPWLLNDIDLKNIKISVFNPDNGIKMEVLSDQPCVVCFTANGLDGKVRGKKNTQYKKYAGLCLETQAVPDAVNRHEFSSIFITPDKPYFQKTIWRFSSI